MLRRSGHPWHRSCPHPAKVLPRRSRCGAAWKRSGVTRHPQPTYPVCVGAAFPVSLIAAPADCKAPSSPRSHAGARSDVALRAVPVLETLCLRPPPARVCCLARGDG